MCRPARSRSRRSGPAPHAACSSGRRSAGARPGCGDAAPCGAADGAGRDRRGDRHRGHRDDRRGRHRDHRRDGDHPCRRPHRGDRRDRRRPWGGPYRRTGRGRGHRAGPEVLQATGERREAAGWACRWKMSAGDREEAEWACPTVRPAAWAARPHLRQEPAAGEASWVGRSAAPTAAPPQPVVREARGVEEGPRRGGEADARHRSTRSPAWAESAEREASEPRPQGRVQARSAGRPRLTGPRLPPLTRRARTPSARRRASSLRPSWGRPSWRRPSWPASWSTALRAARRGSGLHARPCGAHGRPAPRRRWRNGSSRRCRARRRDRGSPCS